MFRAKCPSFNNKIVTLTNNKTKLRHITAIPPTAIIRAILLIPLTATHVTEIIQSTASSQ